MVHMICDSRRLSSVVLAFTFFSLLAFDLATPVSAQSPLRQAQGPEHSRGAGGDFQVEVTKKGLGKEVSIKKGNKEWFMMIEVVPNENTVIVRQEKENDVFLVDESETHDRAMTADEVNAAVDAFVTSVKTQGKIKKK